MVGLWITLVTGGLKIVMEHDSVWFMKENKSGMENNSWAFERKLQWTRK